MQTPIKKQIVSAFLIVGGLVIVLGLIKFFQIRQAIAASQAHGRPPESVTAIKVEPQEWAKTFEAVGSIAAIQGVTLSAESAGDITKINFDSGSQVKKGDIILEIDPAVEEANLKAAIAVRDSAESAYKRSQNLVKNNATSTANLETAEAAYRSAAAEVAALQAQLDKKMVVAPFSGRLGIRLVNLGDYVSPGMPLIPLHDLSRLHVNFSLPQRTISELQIGEKVSLDVVGAAGIHEGNITAVNPNVDQSTRNVHIQATVDNPNETLRAGMYAKVTVILPTVEKFITIPSSSISYAPYGDTVYVIDSMKDPAGNDYQGVKQQIVKLGVKRGDQVAVISGLNEGQQIVTSGTFKLYPGAAVKINNDFQPGNNPSPKPADA